MEEIIMPLAYINHQQSPKLVIRKTDNIDKSLAILLRRKVKKN